MRVTALKVLSAIGLLCFANVSSQAFPGLDGLIGAIPAPGSASIPALPAQLLTAIQQLQVDAQNKADYKTMGTDITNIINIVTPLLKNAPADVNAKIVDIETQIQAMAAAKTADPAKINQIIADISAIGSRILMMGFRSSGSGSFKAARTTTNTKTTTKTTPKSG